MRLSVNLFRECSAFAAAAFHIMRHDVDVYDDDDKSEKKQACIMCAMCVVQVACGNARRARTSCG